MICSWIIQKVKMEAVVTQAHSLNKSAWERVPQPWASGLGESN